MCANEHEGYAISYPAEWHTADLSPESECTWFDPEELEVPENSDVYGFGLEVSPAQESFDAVVRGVTDERFARTIARRDLRVNGLRAVYVEGEATGEGLYEEGTRFAVYVIDRVGRPPLLVQTFREPNEPWDARKRTLDRAARSVIVFRPQRQPQIGSTTALPPEVEQKRDQILAAAQAGEYDELERLADPERFTFTFGSAEGGPAAYWRAEEQRGTSPATILAKLLELPYTETDDGTFVWPWAFDREPAALTTRERQLLSEIATEDEIRGWQQFGSYVGWRVGITPDGRWIFFVAGD